MVTVAVPTSHITTQGTPLKNARERMDVISAYRDVGSYRGAAVDLRDQMPRAVCPTRARRLVGLAGPLGLREFGPPAVP